MSKELSSREKFLEMKRINRLKWAAHEAEEAAALDQI